MSQQFLHRADVMAIPSKCVANECRGLCLVARLPKPERCTAALNARDTALSCRCQRTRWPALDRYTA